MQFFLYFVLKFLHRLPISAMLLGGMMKRRDLESQLKSLGFRILREGGNHTIWTNGTKNIPVPRHNEINELTAKSIIKSAKGA